MCYSLVQQAVFARECLVKVAAQVGRWEEGLRRD
jgi:hypothetical protein